VDVVISSLSDEAGVRSALSGITTVVHLATAEGDRRRRNLWAVDVEGTRVLAAQAQLAGVERLVYLSHLGANRASAYPFLQAKGIAESILRESGIPTLILRSSVIYGVGDSFTNVIAMVSHVLPGIFPLPNFDSSLQPLWVEDLAACMEYCIGEDRFFGEALSLGGPEYLTFQQVVEAVLDVLRIPCFPVRIWPPLLRLGAEAMDSTLPHSPLTPFWLDYLAVHRTCDAGNIPLHFGLKPARLSERIGYLREGRGMRALLRYCWQGDSIFAARGGS
jgi:NADH dehydrogenase